MSTATGYLIMKRAQEFVLVIIMVPYVRQILIIIPIPKIIIIPTTTRQQQYVLQELFVKCSGPIKKILALLMLVTINLSMRSIL